MDLRIKSFSQRLWWLMSRASYGFSIHLLLWIVPIVLVLGFYSGNRFGINTLYDAFRPTQSYRGYTIGVVAALVFIQALFVACLLGERRYVQDSVRPGSVIYYSTVFAPVGVLALCTLLMLYGMTWHHRAGFIATTLTVGLALAIFGDSTQPEPRSLRPINTWLAAKFGQSSTTAPNLRRFYLLAAYLNAILIVIVVFYAVTMLLGADWSPRCPLTPSSAYSLCMLLAVVIGVYGFLSYISRSVASIVLIVPVILWWLGGYPENKYPFQNLPGVQKSSGAKCVILAPGNSAPTIAGKDMQIKDRKLVVVCTTGGGIAAAAWTTAILTRLDEKICAHLRVITGASGGMVGATFYAAAKHKDLMIKRIYDRAIRRIDHLQPVVTRFALHDIFLDFVPLQNTFDRGRALENSFASTWEKSPDDTTTLASLMPDELRGKIPSLVFAPMMVEDSRRLLLSNLDLADCTCNSGNLVGTAGRRSIFSCTALELRSYAPDIYEKLLLSTAARMNASFPYVSPAGTLMLKDEYGNIMRRRIVDSGYYDNYGVDVMARWLFQHRYYFKERNIEILLIQIRLSPQYVDAHTVKPDESTMLDRGVEWACAPVSAAAGEIFRSMLHRNDQLVSELSLEFGDYFSTAILECPERMPLSWYLTKKEINDYQNWANFGREPADDSVESDKRARAYHDWLTRKHEEIEAAESGGEAKENALKVVKANAKFLDEQFKGIQQFMSKPPSERARN